MVQVDVGNGRGGKLRPTEVGTNGLSGPLCSMVVIEGS